MSANGPTPMSGEALRGATLLRQGRAAEAERVLAAALAHDAGNASIAIELARAQIALGRRDEAGATIDALIAGGDAVAPELVFLRAQMLLGESRFAAAATLFQRLVAAAPANAAAELGLAVALGESGRSEAAAEAARRAIAKGNDSAAAHFVLGRALFQSDRLDEAERELRRVLREQPAHVAAHTNLADVLWMRTGDVAAATAEIDATLERRPDLSALRVVKSRLVDSAGDPRRAYDEVAAGLERTPNDVELVLAAARTSVRFDGRRALAHAERALALAPSDPRTLDTAADALLAAGEAARALEACERLLHRNADDGHAIAIRASALRMLDDPDYRALYDYSSFVAASPLDTPTGWDSLTAYLADLAASLHRRHDALKAHPVTQSLREGTQVELRLDDDDPAIRAFASAIDGPIRRMIDALGSGEDPLRRRARSRYRIAEIWSVRLRRSGFHVNHFHGRGWLSSACYIELPEPAALANGAGWIKFGEPFMATTPELPAEYFVRPEPGLLVLFPSWMWHGTMPFESAGDRRRLTIAFDVVPD